MKGASVFWSTHGIPLGQCDDIVNCVCCDVILHLRGFSDHTSGSNCCFCGYSSCCRGSHVGQWDYAFNVNKERRFTSTFFTRDACSLLFNGLEVSGAASFLQLFVFQDEYDMKKLVSTTFSFLPASLLWNHYFTVLQTKIWRRCILPTPCLKQLSVGLKLSLFWGVAIYAAKNSVELFGDNENFSLRYMCHMKCG